MQFFKQTKSYEFVTLLEKLRVERKYINIFIYWFKFFKLDFSINRKIKKSNINEKLELLIILFKERYYLEQLKAEYNIEQTSKLYNTIINNIIISEIDYGTMKIHIEYGLMDNKYSIYVLREDNKGINLTENDLQNKDNYDICNNALYLLSSEICLILINLLADTINMMRRVRKNV